MGLTGYFKMSIEDVVETATPHILGFDVGAFIGAGISKYSEMAAKAAVEVRPELANVDFWTATLAGHSGDWLFYHQPVVGTVFYVALFGLIGLAFGHYLTK